MPPLDPALAHHDPEAWYPLLDRPDFKYDYDSHNSLGEEYAKALRVNEPLRDRLLAAMPKLPPCRYVQLDQIVYGLAGPDEPVDLGPYSLWGKVPLVVRISKDTARAEEVAGCIRRRDFGGDVDEDFISPYSGVRYEVHLLREADRDIVQAAAKDGDGLPLVNFPDSVDYGEFNMDLFPELTALFKHHCGADAVPRIGYDCCMNPYTGDSAWCVRHLHDEWRQLRNVLRQKLGLLRFTESSLDLNRPKLEEIAADKRHAPHVTKDTTLFGSIPTRLYVSIPPSNAKAYLDGKIDADDLWSSTLVVTESTHPARAAIAEALRAAGYKVDENHQGSVRPNKRGRSDKARVVKLADVVQTSVHAAFMALPFEERVAVLKRDWPTDMPWKLHDRNAGGTTFCLAERAVKAARWALTNEALDDKGRQAVEADLAKYVDKLGLTEALDALERDYGVPRSTWPELTLAA